MKILSKDFFLQSVATKNIMATFTVNVISPEDAVITLTADGYPQENNSITVPIGTTVHWEIEKLGYEPKVGDYVVVGDSSITKSLTNLPMCTVSVSPTPLNATVSIRSIDGDWSNGGTTKSLRVPVGTELNISIVHPELNPYSTSVFAQEDTELDVILTNTITVASVPEDALVIINGDPGRSRTQQCNAIVEWEVSKEGYITKSGTLGLNNDGFVPNRISDESGDNRLFVQLDRQVYAIQISVLSPSGVNIEAQIGDGEIISGPDSIIVHGYLGDVIKWSATKEGYVSKSGEFVIDGKTSFEPIRLEVKKYLITINPEPSTCVVTIKSGDDVLKTGSGSQFVNVEIGTELSYTVQSGSVIKTGSLTVSGDQSIDVELAVGTIKVDVFSLDQSELGDSYYCYSVFANPQTIAVSGNEGNVILFNTTGGTLQKKDEQTLGFVKSYSPQDSSETSACFYFGTTSEAKKVSIDPNKETFSVVSSRDFTGSNWGDGTFVDTPQGWLGFRGYLKGSGLNAVAWLGLYLNTEETYAKPQGSTGSIAETSENSRLNLLKSASGSAFANWGVDIARCEPGSVTTVYYDTGAGYLFADTNGYIVHGGSKGFTIFDSSFNRIYNYAAQSYRNFRILGRISDYYYVISYPLSTSASEQKTFLHVFYADGRGLKESVEIQVPGWTMTQKTVEAARCVPHVSQTGCLALVGASGTYGTNNPFVIRVQGY